MSAYTKASSFVLDTLWEDDDFREFFYELGTDLTELGPLTKIVFEPAYLRFKAGLDRAALQMLESQVTEDLISPLLKQKNFRDMWERWDQATRDEFIQEQSELHLVQLLIQVYDQQLRVAYQQAYAEYHSSTQP